MRVTERQFTSLDGMPGFMVFFFRKELLSDLCMQIPLMVRALENLTFCFRTSEREPLDNLLGSEKRKFEQAYEEIN
jgi:hypothetical protein